MKVPGISLMAFVVPVPMSPDTLPRGDTSGG